jgi:hypothetical protein
MSRGDGTSNSPVAAAEQQIEHGVDHELLSKAGDSAGLFTPCVDCVPIPSSDQYSQELSSGSDRLFDLQIARFQGSKSLP